MGGDHYYWHGRIGGNRAFGAGGRVSGAWSRHLARLASNEQGWAMSSFFILIPLSIGMGLVGLLAFLWAMRSDQFDDPVGNAARILDPVTPQNEKD